MPVKLVKWTENGEIGQPSQTGAVKLVNIKNMNMSKYEEKIFEEKYVAVPGDPAPSHRVSWWDGTGEGEKASSNAQYWYFSICNW